MKSKTATKTIRPFVAVAFLCGATSCVAGQTFNFEQHIRPIFREHCLSCHNSQKQSGGLSLETYAELMAGGSSGEVVYAGELDSSRLWALVNHDEEPTMPPNQEKLPADRLASLRQWIEMGLLERADSTPHRPQKVISLTMAAEAGSAKETPGTMPSGIFRQPVTVSQTPGAVLSLAASPTAPLLAVGGPRQIVLFHLDNQQLLGILSFPEGSPLALRFSRDGRWLIAGGGRGGLHGFAAIYDVRDGRRVQTVGDELDCVLTADMDVTCQQIAIGGPTRLARVYDVAQANLRYEINKHTDWVMDLEFSPNGQLLATAGRQGDLFVWEAEHGREYQTLEGHPASITALSWRGDSQLLATASEDGSIRLWNTEQAKPVRSWQAHAGGVLDVDFDRQGRVLSAGRDRHVRLWDATGKALADFPPLDDIAVEAAIGHSSQRAIGGDWQGHLVVWSVDPPAQLASLVTNPVSLEMRVRQAERALQAARQQRRDRLAALQRSGTTIDTTRGQYEDQLNQLVAATQDLESQRLSAENQSEDLDLSEQETQLQQREREVGRLAALARQQELDEQAIRQAIAEAERAILENENRWQVAVAEWNSFRQHIQVLRQRVEEATATVEETQQKLADAQLELDLFQQSFPSQNEDSGEAD